MARIPYTSDINPGPAELVASIRARRGGKLLNIDRMLLNSPPYAVGWGTFLRAVRTELSLPAKLLELAICAVSTMTNCEYELQQHRPAFLSAGGTPEQLAALGDLGTAARNEKLFDATERAILALTLEMTLQVDVSDVTLQRVAKVLSGTAPIVELIGLIAAYNMVTRFVVATGIDLE